jgi:capsular exopolysaccharide synthesis family protein
MDAIDSGVNLRTYLRILRRRKWWVIGCTVVAVVGALAYSFVATKQYSATAQLLIEPQTGSVPFGSTAQTIATNQVATELQLMTSAPVVDAVEAHFHLSKLWAKVAEDQQTNVISVTATNANAAQSARIANFYATDFVEYETNQVRSSLAVAEIQLQGQINAINKELSTTTASPQGTALADQVAALQDQYAQLQVEGAETSGGVSLIASASVPTSPSSPKPVELGAIGLVLGLLVGLCAAFVADSLDTTIRSTDEFEHLVPHVPTVALVPFDESWRDRAKPFLATLVEPTSAATESYRSLCTSLQFARSDQRIRSVLVTSPISSEGKTSTTANLGVVLAQVGQKVVLVSCDLRRPRLAGFFGLDEGVGLTSVMSGARTLKDALQPVRDVPGLMLLGSGSTSPNSAEVLRRPNLFEIFDELKATFDMLLIDSPPVLPVTDPTLLSHLTDVTLLVVAAGKTTKGQLRRAHGQLAEAGAQIFGIVFNKIPRGTSDFDDVYSYLDSYESQNGSSPTPSVPVTNSILQVPPS